MKCCRLSSFNGSEDEECAAHHGMALEPLAPKGKIKSDKENTMKQNTLYSATPIGADTSFYKLVSAIHHSQHFTNFSLFYINNLVSSGCKTFFYKLQVGITLKLNDI